LNVWLVNPFDALPDEDSLPRRYASLAMLLIQEGHNVVWWSSRFSHKLKQFRHSCEPITRGDGVLNIELVDVPSYHRHVGVRRLRNHWCYGRGFAREARESVKRGSHVRPDVVVASSPPLYSARAAITVAAVFGVPSVVDIQDLWPEAFESLLPGGLRQLGCALFYPLLLLENANFRDCAGLCAVSQDYLDRALVGPESVRPTALVHLGVDLARFDANRERTQPAEKNPNEFWVVYVGSVGHNYDLETVVRAAKLLQEQDERQIRFHIVGEGTSLAALRRMSEELGLDNVEFPGFLEPGKMIPILEASDVAINPIRKGTHCAFPNKIFDYCAAGLPIINSISGGELQQLISEEKIGVQYTPGDEHSLSAAIRLLFQNATLRSEMAGSSRKLAEERFDRSVEYRKFLELLKEVIREARAGETRGR